MKLCQRPWTTLSKSPFYYSLILFPRKVYKSLPLLEAAFIILGVLQCRKKHLKSFIDETTKFLEEYSNKDKKPKYIKKRKKRRNADDDLQNEDADDANDDDDDWTSIWKKIFEGQKLNAKDLDELFKKTFQRRHNLIMKTNGTFQKNLRKIKNFDKKDLEEIANSFINNVSLGKGIEYFMNVFNANNSLDFSLAPDAKELEKLKSFFSQFKDVQEYLVASQEERQRFGSIIAGANSDPNNSLAQLLNIDLDTYIYDQLNNFDDNGNTQDIQPGPEGDMGFDDPGNPQNEEQTVPDLPSISKIQKLLINNSNQKPALPCNKLQWAKTNKIEFPQLLNAQKKEREKEQKRSNMLQVYKTEIRNIEEDLFSINKEWIMTPEEIYEALKLMKGIFKQIDFFPENYPSEDKEDEPNGNEPAPNDDNSNQIPDVQFDNPVDDNVEMEDVNQKNSDTKSQSSEKEDEKEDEKKVLTIDLKDQVETSINKLDKNAKFNVDYVVKETNPTAWKERGIENENEKKGLAFYNMLTLAQQGKVKFEQLKSFGPFYKS